MSNKPNQNLRPSIRTQCNPNYINKEAMSILVVVSILGVICKVTLLLATIFLVSMFWKHFIKLASRALKGRD